MNTAALPELPYFDSDLRGPKFRETMRELSEQTWLATSPLALFVLDREAADFFLRSRNTAFPGERVAEVYGIEEGALKEQIDRNILHLHGDAHARLRGRVNHAFTPKAANGWRPVMKGFIEEIADGLRPGECEAIEEICKPYPAMTIARLVGAPVEDAPRLAEWSNWIQKQFAFDFQEQREHVERACEELYEYLDELVAAGHQDGLVEELKDLEDRELVNLVLNVLVGGVDTTQSQLAQALRLFAEHPDQWALLREDPEGRAADAVWAVLHHEPITPFTARICLEDLEFRGTQFPKDTVVMVWAGATPELDILNPPKPRPLAFGAGIHFCLGYNLAKAELEEALKVLAPRMPDLTLAALAAYESIHGIYGLSRLPLEWAA
jgi:cytochrome P450